MSDIPCGHIAGHGAHGTPYAGKMTVCGSAEEHFVHLPREKGNIFTNYRHAYEAGKQSASGYERA